MTFDGLEITLVDELELLDAAFAEGNVTEAEYIAALDELGIGYAVTDDANGQFVLLS